MPDISMAPKETASLKPKGWMKTRLQGNQQHVHALPSGKAFFVPNHDGPADILA